MSVIYDSDKTKRIRITAILAILCSLACSRTPCLSQVEVGITAGMNFASHISEPAQPSYSTTTPRQGLISGAAFRYTLNNFIMTEIGAQYAQRGVVYSESQPDMEFRFMFDYIEVPVLVDPYLSVSSQLRLVGAVGINLAALISVDKRLTIWDWDTLSNLSSYYNPFDLCMELGLGSDYRIGSNFTITAMIRYLRGLRDLNKEQYSRYDVTSDLRALVSIYYQISE